MIIFLILLMATVLISGINVYLWQTWKSNGDLHRLIGGAAWYLLFHSVYVIIVRTCYPEYPYLNLAAPFILFYGPMVYALLHVYRWGSLKRSTIIFHFFIPAIFWVGFISGFVVGEYSTLFKTYKWLLSYTSLISLGGYTIYVIFSSPRILSSRKVPILPLSWFTIPMGIMLIISFATYLYKGEFRSRATLAPLLLNSMVYLLMLIASLNIFRQLLLLLKPQHQPINAIFSVDQKIASYQKSSLSQIDMADIEKKIVDGLTATQLFLDSELSLTSFAAKLRVPPHHLTQTMSLHMGTNFSDLINTHRVRMACQLLKNPDFKNLEDIAERSGFNSRASLSRNFKKVMCTTPMAYRSEVI